MRAVDKLRRALGAVAGESLGNDYADAILGDDILDLSPFGGRWENALRSLYTSGEVAEKARAVIEGRISFTNLDYHERAALHPPLRAEPRMMAAIGVALPSGRRASLEAFLGISRLDLDSLVGTRSSYMGRTATGEPKHGWLSVDDLTRLAPVFGWPPNALGDLVFNEGKSWQQRGVVEGLKHLDGFDRFIVERADSVRSIVAPPAKAGHEWMWQRVAVTGPETRRLFLPELAAAAAANAKAIRELALSMLDDLPRSEVVEAIQTAAEEGNASATANALDALATLANDDERPELVGWAQTTFESSRSASVAEAVARLTAMEDRVEVELPPLPELDYEAADQTDFPKIFNVHNNRTDLIEVLTGRAAANAFSNAAWMFTQVMDTGPAGLQLSDVHLCRVILASRLRYIGRRQIKQLMAAAEVTPAKLLAVARHDGNVPTAVVSAVGAVIGADPRYWTGDQLAVWAAHDADTIVGLLNDRDADWHVDRLAAFKAVGLATTRPPHLDEALAAAAVSGYKSDRELLYEIVDESFTDLVLPYLANRAKADRKGAADWIRTYPTEAAVKPLLTAARKEKDDGVKASMLSALEVLRVDIDGFISPEALAADATKAMSRRNAIPKAIEWLDFEHLPPLTWAGGDSTATGAPVELDVVKMFIVNAVKAKTAEPSPILRRHFDNMDQTQVRAFGRALLDWWMAEDLRTYTAEEARAEAQRQAPQQHQWSQRGYGSYKGMTQQQIEDALYGELLTTVLGSATTSKGVLAVVAASAGGEVADKALAYIRRHRGQRVNQAKILLQMLAWIDEPASVQAVMAIAARFRPKGIQDEAVKQAELLAERRGWTLDDLADRSVPDGGFDAEGRRVFDYGTRTFTAHLNDDLTVSLTNDETGKSVRSLPKGRADEDADVIKELKAELSAAKKDLKSTAKIQPERLYQAMCAQRTWTVDDFTRYLVTHPVMVRLASRLVWCHTTPDGAAALFRPLTDGTLLDADDDDVTLADDDVVTIAHGQLISTDETTAWKQHLIDYEVQPLFPQFDRPSFEAAAAQTTIDDFYGYVLTDNNLRSQMNRLAWQIGPPQDGGVAGEIIKPFGVADITAVLALGENGLSAARYDGDLTISIRSLFFVRSSEAGGWYNPQSARELSELPPVMLSEIYAEVRTIAESGSGFDPRYAKKPKK